MERETVRAVPELQALHEALETAGVADMVWEVVGGNPASYYQLRHRWVRAQLLGRLDTLRVSEDFMRDQLSSATEVFNDVKAANRSLVVPVYDCFKTVDMLPASIREWYVLPSPDKVLRLVKKEGDDEGMLKPATPAMALVLRHSVGGKPPSLEDVRKALLAPPSAPIPQLE